MLKTLGVVLVVGLAVTGLATASAQKEAYRLSAKLTAGAEVPKPTNVPAAATGTFTGTAVELSNDKVRLTWKLTYSHLSGKAVAAHIHVGKKGQAGNVLVPLCPPCKSVMTGKTVTTHAVLKKIEAGLTYVNVHTPKNAAGEIRGQVKASGS